MASFLNSFFNKKGSIDEPLGATRTVNLSGNYFSFAMPEDFSKDMPAEDLIENLDITDLKKFDKPEYGNLIRRWWDIREPGFFGKNLGTVMMEMSIQPVSSNQQKRIHDRSYDISDRLDFLLMINDSLHQRYDELIEQTKNLDDKMRYSIPGVAFLMGEKIETEYRDYINNKQKWIGYSATAPVNQLIAGLVTPLTQQLYIEVVFSYAPNQGVLPMKFLDFALEKSRAISKTFTLKYDSKNLLKFLTEKKDWQEMTNNQIVQKNKNILLIPLFGPDIYERLSSHDKNAAEVMKLLVQPEGKSE